MTDTVEAPIIKMMKVLMKVPQYQERVCFDVLTLSDQEFVIKWQSDYDRIMQMKAFL
jgi:hypothetical protein